MHAASDTRTIDVDTDLAGHPVTHVMKVAMLHAADNDGRTWTCTHPGGTRVTTATLTGLARRGLVTLEVQTHNLFHWTGRGDPDARVDGRIRNAELTDLGRAVVEAHDRLAVALLGDGSR